MISFALISVVTLKSIAPDLATTQLVFWLVSLGAFFLITKFKIGFFKRNHLVGYLGVNFALLFTLAVGTVTKGATRWIDVGFFSIQPSQLAIPVVGFTAALFASKHRLDRWQNIAIFLGILALPALLILIEPDLGTTILFLITTGAILFFSEIKDKYLLGIFGFVVVVAIVGWILILKDYQKARVTSFAQSMTTGKISVNYNAYQSQIAVGSGQLLGKGLGHGSQSQLRFLPERQTDFVFASFAEEWGFVGSSIILGLYLLLGLYLIYYIFKFKTKFEQYYLLITLTMLSFQVFVNVGMNVGLLPITGVTLPFVSYGGSSLISICIMLGVAQNIINSHSEKVSLDIR